MEPQKSQKSQQSRFRIEPLEERIAPAHLGHVVNVTVPEQAVPGLSTAQDTPAAHTRAYLIVHRK